MVILTNQMSLVSGLSSSKLGLVTCHIVLCSCRNRRLLNLETDHSRLIPTAREKPSHTGRSSVLDLVTCSPMSRTHWIPKLETDRPQKNRTSQVRSVGQSNQFCPLYQPIFSEFDGEFSDGRIHEQADAGAPGDEIFVSPKTFRKSGFVQGIGHCDEAGVTFPFCHWGVTSGGDSVE